MGPEEDGPSRARPPRDSQATGGDRKRVPSRLDPTGRRRANATYGQAVSMSKSPLLYCVSQASPPANLLYDWQYCSGLLGGTPASHSGRPKLAPPVMTPHWSGVE